MGLVRPQLFPVSAISLKSTSSPVEAFAISHQQRLHNSVRMKKGKKQNESPLNPLIDDLMGELTMNNSKVAIPGGKNGLLEGIGELESWTTQPNNQLSLVQGQTNSLTNGTYKLLCDTISQGIQHFTLTLQKHGMSSYLNIKSDSEKEVELKRMLREKNQNDVDGLVLSLIEIFEEMHNTFKQIGPTQIGLFSPSCGDSRGRMMSNSILSTMSTASLMRPPVHETHRVAVAYDHQGNRMINRYVVLADLGKGSCGRVKLGQETDTGRKVAIKIIDKRFLNKKFGSGINREGDNALKREIAIMKKVRHRNCVSLHEVIDDPDSQKLFLIMDYVSHGPLLRLKENTLMPAMLAATEAGKAVDGVHYNAFLIRCGVRQCISGTTPLSKEEINSKPSMYMCKPIKEDMCAVYLRQMVSGLRYMHKRHVVHHDIKPDNILLGYDNRVYLADFGVSEMLEPQRRNVNGLPLQDAAHSQEATNDDEDKKQAEPRVSTARLGGGTLLFSAPELFSPNEDADSINPFLTDVWALGVTLYCMLVGTAPFNGNTYHDLSNNICTMPYPWNGLNLEGEPLLECWNKILSGLLQKDPSKRWSLENLKNFLDHAELKRKLLSREGRGLVSAPRATAPSAMMPASLRARRSAPSAQATEGHEAHHHRAKDNYEDNAYYLRRIGISDRDVEEATRQERVRVMLKPLDPISSNTRRIVSRFVNIIRDRLKCRDRFFRLSRRSALFAEKSDEPQEKAGIAFLLSTACNGMPMDGSIPRAQRSRIYSKKNSLSNSLDGGNVKIATLRTFQRTSLNAANQGTLNSENLMGDLKRNANEAVLNGTGQSIDGMLSILNVQSESFTSYSFSSSFRFDQIEKPEAAHILNKDEGVSRNGGGNGKKEGDNAVKNKASLKESGQPSLTMNRNPKTSPNLVTANPAFHKNGTEKVNPELRPGVSPSNKSDATEGNGFLESFPTNKTARNRLIVISEKGNGEGSVKGSSGTCNATRGAETGIQFINSLDDESLNLVKRSRVPTLVVPMSSVEEYDNDSQFAWKKNCQSSREGTPLVRQAQLSMQDTASKFKERKNNVPKVLSAWEIVRSMEDVQKY